MIKEGECVKDCWSKPEKENDFIKLFVKNLPAETKALLQKELAQEKNNIKFYWWKCREKATGAEVEVCVGAKDFWSSQNYIMKDTRYVPLLYMGWTENGKKEKGQLDIYDFIKEER